MNFHGILFLQARAPNSPVIIVGTHYDIIMRDKKYSKEYWPDLKRTIAARFINIAHPQDVGLPHVVACIEVSCAMGSKSYNVAVLRDLVYDTAYTLTGTFVFCHGYIYVYHQLRARRALLLYKVYGDSALLALN